MPKKGENNRRIFTFSIQTKIRLWTNVNPWVFRPGHAINLGALFTKFAYCNYPECSNNFCAWMHTLYIYNTSIINLYVITWLHINYEKLQNVLLCYLCFYSASSIEIINIYGKVLHTYCLRTWNQSSTLSLKYLLEPIYNLFNPISLAKIYYAVETRNAINQFDAYSFIVHESISLVEPHSSKRSSYCCRSDSKRFSSVVHDDIVSLNQDRVNYNMNFKSILIEQKGICIKFYTSRSHSSIWNTSGGEKND